MLQNPLLQVVSAGLDVELEEEFTLKMRNGTVWRDADSDTLVFKFTKTKLKHRKENDKKWNDTPAHVLGTIIEGRYEAVKLPRLPLDLSPIELVEKNVLLKKIRDYMRELEKHSKATDSDFARTYYLAMVGGVRGCMDIITENESTLDPYKHASIDHYRYLYRVDGHLTVRGEVKCSACQNDINELPTKFCSNCGSKFDAGHRYFRKLTRFVEQEDNIIQISKQDFENADDWTDKV